ncbi:MAG: acyl transferase [Bacteroidetes bacterium]|nr:acyl transferase [Bacteroidota bacterium]
MFFDQITEAIFSQQSVSAFNETAIELFHFQYKNNTIYKQFVDLNHINPIQVKTIAQIPFLPIEFFKSHNVVCGEIIPTDFFESSGTSGMQRSRHYFRSLAIYEESFLKGFAHFYGNIEDYCLLAVLPNYLEQKHSSLIYMITKLIEKTNHPDSGFYLNDLKSLSDKLMILKNTKQKTILFGVTYALLDLAEKYPLSIPDTIIFETGGMKGKRKEMLKEELHSILQKAFNVAFIHGEYGMTELFSQAYSKGKGIFMTPPWMKIFIRDINDHKTMLDFNKTGGINVIDLANIYSCSFIATQDLGKLHEDVSFEILGRFDHSDIRGCNLMIE